jgi:hypothetical protein
MRDTTEPVLELQARIQERLGGAGRLRLAYELSETARALALAGLQLRQPTWTAAQLYWALYTSRRPSDPPPLPAQHAL